ncbi:MAG: phosphoenolpyruvate carboxykinase (ATP), partial [Thermoproteota archaeon]
MDTNLINRKGCFKNSSKAFLIEQTVKTGFGTLSKDGALCVVTGEKTGRSPKDKYVVESEYVNSKIDWANDIHKMTGENFDKIKMSILNHYETNENLYYSTKSVGTIDKYSMNVQLLTTHPSFNLFFNNMFRDENKDAGVEPYCIYHAPTFKMKSEGSMNLISGTVIAINFEKKEVLICGSEYAGEIKKSIFSIMNFLLPDRGVLPMHAGANIDAHGNTSVFFGLSGTGKTTLSTDQGTQLIGDDEHGLCEDGTFNFEGGCYAKTFKLTSSGEPEIYVAANTFGS